MQCHLITIATECPAANFPPSSVIQNPLKSTIFFTAEVNIAIFIFRTSTFQAAAQGTLYKRLEVSN